jgi:hypothetical protein
MMMSDVESNLPRKQQRQQQRSGPPGRNLLLWFVVVGLSLCCVTWFVCTWFGCSSASQETDMELGGGSSSFLVVESSLSSGIKGSIPRIKPIHPLHHGKVNYLITMGVDRHVEYKRTFQAPCAYGMLVFNIGPALDNLPFAYDIYDDAYAYSDNQGLCFFYPSWKGVQTSDQLMWKVGDPTELRVPLGDHENKISSRVVIPENAKTTFVPKRGGDFLIIRKGNFYDPQYYKQIKAYVNNMPADSNINDMLEQFEYDVEKKF